MEEVERTLQASGVIVQPYWRSIFCHMSDDVENYAMHPTFEMHFEETSLA
jgi:peptide/nickel transport system substrate-binding protein